MQYKQGNGKYHGDVINCPQCNRLKRQYSNCMCGYTIAEDPNIVEIMQGCYITQDKWEEIKQGLAKYWSR